LLIDGRQVLQTLGNGKLRDTLAEIYGVETARVMLEVRGSSQESGIVPVVSGYTSPSSVSRANRAYLSFFVNRRWIQSRLLASAVEKAYEGWLGTGRYPISVVHLTIEPNFVDVNVHPTKREIRFSQEPIIFSAVQGAIRRALMEKSPIPELKPSTTPIMPAAAFGVKFPGVEASTGSPPVPMPGMVRLELPALRVLGQAASTYIIAEGPDGLYLIDQHAAHERVLYDRILAQWGQRAVEAQALLEPLTIEFNVKQQGLLQSHGGALADFGFTIETFGERTYLVRAVPAMLVGKSIAETVKEIVDSFDEEGGGAKPEENITRSLACHGSVRAGQMLSQEEMRELVRQLEATRSPRTCPHGRPTMIHLSSYRLEKEFGRA
jgi:DNA mismatch repair protein MutL